MRKLQARTAATRDRLLAAGHAIVAAGGMAALRTDEVVLRAGVAKGTFFAHFIDRDQFLAALLAQRLTAKFEGLAAPKDRAGLAQMLDQVFTAFAEDAETVALLARFSGPIGEGLGIDTMICEIIDRLATGLAEMQATERVTNPASPAVLAEALVALVFHAAASAQCPAQGDMAMVRARAERLLLQMTEALLGA